MFIGPLCLGVITHKWEAARCIHNITTKYVYNIFISYISVKLNVQVIQADVHSLLV